MLQELINKTLEVEKKLAIAVKALQFYADKNKWHNASEDTEHFYSTTVGWYEAEQALKEMEKVQ